MNFSEFRSDLVTTMSIVNVEENSTHPMSLLIMMAACECVIALFALQLVTKHLHMYQYGPRRECKNQLIVYVQMAGEQTSKV